ncbi:hypothetical protein ACFCYX_37995 [Streptomyces populi]|uniref:hypothetical protein n=1 Tax=Streptomyces populi TaxID=2058924 RepID=UPI0035D927EF
MVAFARLTDASWLDSDDGDRRGRGELLGYGSAQPGSGRGGDLPGGRSSAGRARLVMVAVAALTVVAALAVSLVRPDTVAPAPLGYLGCYDWARVMVAVTRLPGNKTREASHPISRVWPDQQAGPSDPLDIEMMVRHAWQNRKEPSVR